jgi:hypothetical protein
MVFAFSRTVSLNLCCCSLPRALVQLQQWGATVDIQAGDGCTPLHTAMALQPSVTKLTIIATLLVAGADIDMKVLVLYYYTCNTDAAWQCLFSAATAVMLLHISVCAALTMQELTCMLR